MPNDCGCNSAPSGLGCALDPHAREVNANTLRAINEQGELIAAKRYRAKQLRRAAKSEDLQANDLQSNLQAYCRSVEDNDPGSDQDEGGDA